MVNLVLVSHSHKLAEGILELALQMTRGKVAIAIAAGIDDSENPIGTNPIAILNAIQSVYSHEGVLILVDIGSAILSTESALELLEPEQAGNVYICAAPIVEGTIAASVSAAAGMPVEAVIRETHEAILAKYQALEQHLPVQLNAQEEASSPQKINGKKAGDNNEQIFSWTVSNPNGLHARPAAIIVAALRPFHSKVSLIKAGKKVNAKSLNKIMMLGITYGDELIFTAHGNDATKAIDTLKRLAKKHFGEQIKAKQN